MQIALLTVSDHLAGARRNTGAPQADAVGRLRQRW
jgi:hypothetical protein